MPSHDDEQGAKAPENGSSQTGDTNPVEKPEETEALVPSSPDSSTEPSAEGAGEAATPPADAEDYPIEVSADSEDNLADSPGEIEGPAPSSEDLPESSSEDSEPAATPADQAGQPETGEPAAGEGDADGGSSDADSRDPYLDDGYLDSEASDQYPNEDGTPNVDSDEEPSANLPAKVGGDGGSVPPPVVTSGDKGDETEDDDEEGMVRMSFMDHLDELRRRIILSLAGIGVAFLASLIFANQLWIIVSEPAMDALTKLGLKDPRLAQITPMEVFSTVWVKLPMLASIFLASPWILYQVWAFIAPGLYWKERRWAGPFVIISAGLFILGGLFAYFVAFRFGLVFLLGIGRDIRIQPLVSVTEYFNLFVNVTLGVGIVFELPVLIFFLTLLRIVNPSFLLRNSRYALLIIVILAAVITPTPDVFNLMLFSVPMVVLYFVGVFASYLLVLQREQRHFPWKKVFFVLLIVLALVAAVLFFVATRYGYHFVPYWPFLVH